MQRAFERLAEARDEDPVLHIEQRELRARRRAGGVVWFDFKTLCGGPRSQNDYLELAAAVPHRAAVGRAADAAAPGQRGAPLHLAGRRAVRPPRQADHVGRGAARGAVHGRAAGARVPAHRVAAATRCSRRASWRCSGATSTPRSPEAADAGVLRCSGLLRGCARRWRMAAQAADDDAVDKARRDQIERRARRGAGALRPGRARVRARASPSPIASTGPRPSAAPRWTAAQREQAALDDAERKRRAEERRQRIAQKQARQQLAAERAAAAAASSPRCRCARRASRWRPARAKPARRHEPRSAQDGGSRRGRGGRARGAVAAAARARAGARGGGAQAQRRARRTAARPRRRCRCRRRPAAGVGDSGERVDADQRQRQVVAAAAGALTRLADQHLAGLARRQRVHDGTQLLGREVVPQAVAAGQQAVADLELVDVRRWPAADRCCVPRQPVSRLRLRMGVGLAPR